MAANVVQVGGGTNPGGGATASTGTGNPALSSVTSGNYLDVYVIGAGGSPGTPSLSSTGTATLGTAVLIDTAPYTSGASLQISHYLVPITGSGSLVLSGTISGQSFMTIIAAELSGLSASAAFVTGEVANSLQFLTSSSADALTSGNTPGLAEANGFLCGLSLQVNGNATPSAGTGFMAPSGGPYNFAFGATPSITYEYQQLSSNAAVAATFTCATLFTNYINTAAVFVPASAGVSGSAAIAEGADAVSGTGKTTIVGTAAITEGFDTVAGVGKTTIVGSASIKEGADTVAGSGVTTITGTAAITEGADTVTASGATNPAGVAAITEGTDVVTASGVTTIVATAAIVEGADTVTASGTSGSTVIGTASITEGADTVSGAGTTTIVASAAIAEGADTVTASGTTTIVGAAAIFEGGDIVVASGVAGIVTGSAAIAEGADSVDASGQSGSTQPAGKHRKRYGVMDGWRLLLFNTKADADAFKTARKQAKSPAKALKRIRTVEPVQVINIPELKRSLPPPQAARVDQMLKEHRFEQVAQLPNIAAQYDAQRREEAEITEVSHVIEAHRQTSIEHAQAIHQALKVLHDIRKLRRLQ